MPHVLAHRGGVLTGLLRNAHDSLIEGVRRLAEPEGREHAADFTRKAPHEVRLPEGYAVLIVEDCGEGIDDGVGRELPEYCRHRVLLEEEDALREILYFPDASGVHRPRAVDRLPVSIEGNRCAVLNCPKRGYAEVEGIHAEHVHHRSVLPHAVLEEDDGH